MKPISLTLNNLDFVIHPFQKTRMNGESTMIDYAVGISDECFGEIDYGCNPTFKRNTAPVGKCPGCPAWIAVLPELFQIILQNI